MKEAELRKHADCSACSNKIGHTGLPLFWVVKANIPLIDTLEKMDTFNKQYSENTNRCMDILWGDLKQKYDGLIIAPYQWERRLDLMWYYSWDCASGVIWNLDAVDTVTALCSQPE